MATWRLFKQKCPVLFAQGDQSDPQGELETPLGLGPNAFPGSTCVFLRVFGHVDRKGVQGRGVGERVNPPPKEGLETPTKGSTDFRMHLGSLLGPTLGTFCDFSMILGAKVMMPECSSCMCLNHCKNYVFFYDFTFPTFSVNWCPGGGFRCHFGDFW